MQAAGDDESVKAECATSSTLGHCVVNKTGNRPHIDTWLSPSEQVASSFQCENLAVGSGLETDEETALRDVHIPYNKDQTCT